MTAGVLQFTVLRTKYMIFTNAQFLASLRRDLYRRTRAPAVSGSIDLVLKPKVAAHLLSLRFTSHNSEGPHQSPSTYHGWSIYRHSSAHSGRTSVSQLGPPMG